MSTSACFGALPVGWADVELTERNGTARDEDTSPPPLTNGAGRRADAVFPLGALPRWRGGI
ncbi:hypothetical protein HMPREF0972_00918 [Actinomyces sp. oral taxon 848 str. F0332]|nr:hypothetical protein HMPREF0972_00918 [Actinomyces sp. oral taxon 848 str. F0332]